MNSGTAQSSLPIQLQTVDKRRPKVPFKSQQRKWMNANRDKVGAKTVDEFNQSSKGLNLPEKAPSSRAGKRIAKKK
ncbi:MAG TPA: hypothetical protein VMQ76_06500 [Terracidiphilus sp.]|jgi:hypothetical protein|nr:hypothetical protein [Terracidiphilus sp.]